MPLRAAVERTLPKVLGFVKWRNRVESHARNLRARFGTTATCGFTGTFRRCSANGLMLSAMVLLLGFSLRAQHVEYSKVMPAVLERRLKMVEDKNARREKVIFGLFQEAGCLQDALIEQPVKGSRTANIICTLSGASDASIVVGAHYDKVPTSSGVIDNWSGSSMLPSLFEGLHAKSHRSTFVFAGFTDEEEGLVGSRYFVKHLEQEQRRKIHAMVNIDSLGLAETEVWLSRADKSLARAAGMAAHSLNLPLTAVNVERVGNSDSQPFVDRKIPVIDFHSLTQATLHILHSPEDCMRALHMAEYERSYELLVAYLAVLDATLDPSSAAAETPRR